MTYRALLFPAHFQSALRASLRLEIYTTRLALCLPPPLTNQSRWYRPSILTSTTCLRRYSAKYQWRRMERVRCIDKPYISLFESYSSAVATLAFFRFIKKASIFSSDTEISEKCWATSRPSTISLLSRWYRRCNFCALLLLISQQLQDKSSKCRLKK